MSHVLLGRVAPLLLTLLLSSFAAFAQSSERDQIVKEIEAWQEQIKAKEKVLFAPAKEDRLAFAEFLSQPETGLIRLLPREKYDGKLSLRGGGAYYSFTKLVQEYGDSSDISLEQNTFNVGFHGADFGFLCRLGDVPLEEVTLNHPGAQFLSDYSPPLIEGEARVEQRRAALGFQANEFSYKNRLPVQINATYLLRSISYDDADSLVAFRAVRKDTDGSVILIWKMLKRFPKPQLIRDKTAKL